MSAPVINIGSVSNVYSRMMHFRKAGDVELGHKHHYDHLTLLANGSLKIIVEEKETIFKAPFMIYIKAEKNHKLVALEDNTVAYCVHAIRNKDTQDILDPSMIPDGINTEDLLKISGPFCAD